MQTDNLKAQIDKLLDEVDGPDEPGIPEEPITEGDFTELIEGEVIDNPPRPHGIPLRWLIPVGFVSLALALLGVLVIVPLFAASATIMITPDVQPVSVNGQITVSAQTLVHKTITLSEQVATTGSAHQAATQASGWVTLYNSLQTPQTIPAGTLLIGADGTHVTTDGDVYIPAGTLVTNGSASVRAYTSIAGSAGNIAAGDINGPCCRDYVFAYNGAFSGGQSAREYKTATTADSTAASQELAALITKEIATDAQSQLSPHDTMGAPQCQYKTTMSPKPGSEASQATVTVMSTCTVYGYDRLVVAGQEQALFMQAMQDQLGTGYSAKGTPTETVSHATLHGGMLLLAVTLTGSSMYQFRVDELQHIQQLVAGRSREQATTLLLHTRGVRTVGIQIASGRSTIPDNMQHVYITVYERA